MSLFRKNPPPQNAAFRQDESRLARLRDAPGLFTSNFSVNELAMCASAGIRPLGQVIGSTIYQIGWQSPPFQSGELTYVTQAYREARQLVFSRLQHEAALLGANGVLGVHISQTDLLQGGMLEWSASGTAVAMPEQPFASQPFLYALSVQEFWALRQAGYRPVGLASGVCGYYQKGDCRFRNIISAAGSRPPNFWYPKQSQAYSTAINKEDAGLTDGIYKARAQAMRRLEGDAIAVRASGVIGTGWEMKTKLQEAKDLNDTFRTDAYLFVSVLGTTIASSDSGIPTVDYAVPLV